MTATRCRNVILGVCLLLMGLGCNNPFAGLPSPSPPSTASEALPVTVTPKAAATIRQLIADQQLTEKVYLRLRVVPGGCQGYTHKLDLDPKVTDEDQVSESLGISVVVFKRQAEMLRGAQVDFGECDGQQGFKIDNPNFQGEAAKRWLAELEQEKDVK